MLDIQKMIDSAQEALGWPYVSPGSNDKNGIDCSGLFVKMYKDQGAKIYHGSNTIYRNYCTENKGKIDDISVLKPGVAVFKWKEKTPDKFKDGLGDFCHIGIVISVNPLRIIHASSASGCVTTDSKLGKWKYYGYLKDVDYKQDHSPAGSDDDISDEPYEPLCYATVYSENRKPVKLRAKPSTNCSLYDDVPFGAIVEVEEKGEEWSKVNYRNRIGWYMMTRFLLIDEDSIPNVGGSEDIIEEPPTYYVSISISNIRLEEAQELLKKYPQAEIIAG